MSELVEKVAAAISASFHEEGYIEGQSDPSEWAEFQKAARRVLEALKEPSDEMLRVFLKDGWNAMIDEALK